jgi:NAD(P)-dependent dehydrogenase (short-subunit alcohol dehydrogenase family)
MKVAVVTGAARGIGKEIAVHLSKAGYKVAICDVIDFADAGERGFDYFKCDISDSGSRKRFFSEVYNKYGRLDVLVNNAGVAPKQRLDILETTEENFGRVIDINLIGTFFMCQEGAKYLLKTLEKQKAPPRIVNISSMSAYTSSVSRGEYCISKAGVSMVTKLFADRLAEFGIPVFEVRPGIILTDMTAGVEDKYRRLIDEGITPIKRFGLPEDIAKAVTALCGGALDFCTGQAIEADGGFHIRRL